MKQIATYKLLRILPVGLLLIFLATVLNDALYLHTHLMPDGSFVLHAHPFDRSDENKNNPENSENHHHDCFELVWANSLKNYFPLTNNIIHIDGDIARDIRQKEYNVLLSEFLTFSSEQGRAPPRCF